jgi:hypothetical protein
VNSSYWIAVRLDSPLDTFAFRSIESDLTFFVPECSRVTQRPDSSLSKGKRSFV